MVARYIKSRSSGAHLIPMSALPIGNATGWRAIYIPNGFSETRGPNGRRNPRGIARLNRLAPASENHSRKAAGLQT